LEERVCDQVRLMSIAPDPADLSADSVLQAARHRAQLLHAISSVRIGLSLVTIRRAEPYGAAHALTLAALSCVYGVSVDDLGGMREVAK
jgi:hypothetical protein